MELVNTVESLHFWGNLRTCVENDSSIKRTVNDGSYDNAAHKDTTYDIAQVLSRRRILTESEQAGS